MVDFRYKNKYKKKQKKKNNNIKYDKNNNFL